MIGGYDMVFHLQVPDNGASIIASSILEYWPDALCENPATSKIAHLSEMGNADFGFEFFIYRDEMSYREWTDGPGEDCENYPMINVILRTGELTLVVDRPESEQAHMAMDVYRTLQLPHVTAAMFAEAA